MYATLEIVLLEMDVYAPSGKQILRIKIEKIC